jgi:MFS family permease
MVMVIMAVMGLANAFDLPARQTLVADLVSEDHMRNAVTLGSLEANAARLVGPTVGALCLAHVSIAACFILDALSFVVALAGLRAMHSNEFFTQGRAAISQPVKGQLRESITYLRGNALARTILLMMILIGTLACEFFVTLPLLAKTTFEGNAGTYAAMTVAMGSGAIVGGLFIAGKKASASIGSLTRYAVALGVAMILVASVPSFSLVLVVLFFAGAAQLILTTSGNAMLMLHTAPEMRGRMNAWWVMIFMGSTPIGGPLMGWIAQESTPGFAIAIGGLSCIVAAAWTYSYRHAFTLAALHPGRRYFANLSAHFSRSS